jgi:putative membrane protein
MTLAMVVFWGAIAVVVVTVLRHRGTPPVPDQGPSVGAPSVPPAPHSGAFAILADRFARGEIDEAEYARRRSVIEGSG